MSVPKSVTKVSRDGSYKFVSNVEAVEYTMNELIRGALRDCGKLITRRFKTNFYSIFKKRTGNVGRDGSGYWVRRRECDLQVGLHKEKSKGWYARFQETGTQMIPKYGLLRKTTEDSIQDMIKIQGNYLSELNKDKPNLRGIDEGDMEGD